MATNFYARTSLTGGAPGALDELDGAGLHQGDVALIANTQGFFVYFLDEESGASASPPEVVEPLVNAGDKRWVLKTHTQADSRYCKSESNLSDLSSPASSRENLGLGSLSTQDSDSVDISGGTLEDLDYVKAGGAGVGHGYLELTSSGGARIGRFCAMDSNPYICIGAKTSHNLSIIKGNTSEFTFSNTNFIPSDDGCKDLGNSTRRWADIYAANGVIQTSDANLKEEIADCPLGLDFILALRPKSFKWKDQAMPARKDIESGETVEPERVQVHSRRHHGLMAQDVEKALSAMSTDTENFAGIIKDKESGRLGLRYQEFLAPLICAVQELSARVMTLEARQGGEN